MREARSARTDLDFTDRVGALVGAMTEDRGDGKAGEMLSKGFEIVVTSVIFGFLGSLVDRWLGTSPLFLLLMGGFAFGYVVWKMVRGYHADMDAEADRILPAGAKRGAPDQGGAT